MYVCINAPSDVFVHAGEAGFFLFNGASYDPTHMRQAGILSFTTFRSKSAPSQMSCSRDPAHHVSLLIT